MSVVEHSRIRVGHWNSYTALSAGPVLAGVCGVCAEELTVCIRTDEGVVGVAVGGGSGVGVAVGSGGRVGVRVGVGVGVNVRVGVAVGVCVGREATRVGGRVGCGRSPSKVASGAGRVGWANRVGAGVAVM